MQEFVKAALAGNTSAWNMLYRHNYARLYAKALSICSNTAAAKDAVQDTFIQAYLKLNQLKDPAAFPGWLMTILMRSCYHTKQDNFLINYNNVFPLPKEKYWEDEINNKIELFARQAKLYSTLCYLPDTLQSVLLLRYFSNWKSYEQMAKILSIPVGTVRSRLNQAKQKLREHWLKDSVDNEKAFQESNEWNHFYSNYFETVHFSLNNREKFIQHFDKNLELIFTSGKTAFGRKLIEKEIEEDLLHGSVFADVQVMTAGTLSIVEVRNIHSKEYPDRCPDSGIFVLYRRQNKVNRLNFHNSK
ncbi:RNA polymerase sigma factor [Segetibacter koreensis]|uniref:RNA polymerase sigma factor n=1 Tax=Segetibacter koreensis TaxID=398037 RepID=UPI0003676C36|nr:RNA polymerase sigma factor [Segetibacter koreensis]